MSQTTSTNPQIRLNDGVTIPQLGFGVFQVPPEDTEQVVTHALEVGFRSIDTAAGYKNEEGVGAAVAASGLARDEIFVTTKLANPDQGHDSALAAFDASMGKLDLDVLDLYLIHWPSPARGEFVNTWKAFIELQQAGRIRSIGVSNFLPHHFTELFEATEVVPSVNQIELHPYLQQKELRTFHAQHGILTEAWSPIAQGDCLDDPIITGIAERLGATAAQVVLRWHLQLGNIVIPKSVTPSRMRENLGALEITLGEEDIAAIEGLDRGEDGRRGFHPDRFNAFPEDFEKR
ncbi:aldo/keto reductase [Georgenia halophila]|uniref:Aldo/keto reductase n=1 Tax=Georgenia halophila TaxID=620889 RepID=A0ABP8LD03_9MICO